jgi:hypothetical protein
MNRKSVLLGVGIAIFLLGGGTALTALFRHQPAFYNQAVQEPGKARKQYSGEFITHFGEFCEDVHSAVAWNAHFEEKWVNSFFDEQFVDSGWAEKILPEGISAPRISIRSDKIRLAFRYDIGFVDTVISIDLRMWLTKEPNVVALELQALHAGALPIAAQSLLERVSEAARQNNIEVTWYRYHGNPVALLRFQADQDHATIRLEQLALHEGAIDIAGHSLEDLPLHSVLRTSLSKTAAN